MTLNIVRLRGSHFDIGHEIGVRFQSEIARTLNDNQTLQETVLPYHHSAVGQRRYANLLALHRERFPDYVHELEGMSAGAQQPLDMLMLINLRGEYGQYVMGGDDFGCSTCSVATGNLIAFGHNEDGAAIYQQAMYLLELSIPGKPRFTAFCYPGFLPGNAFGFNVAGICHAINNVRPHTIDNGIGRHFLARSLFEAESIDDAIARVTIDDRASGFNYTIGSIRERRLVDVEVSPSDYTVIEIRDPYFHTNHYLHLDSAEQTIMPSSWVRAERGERVLSKCQIDDSADILTILRDNSDSEYPILRNGQGPDELVTLSTGLFDLEQRLLTVYSGAEPFELLHEIPIAVQE